MRSDGRPSALTETLIADVQVPQIYPEIVGRHVGLPITVDADRIDVVGVGVGVHLPRDGCYDVVVEGHPG